MILYPPACAQLRERCSCLLLRGLLTAFLSIQLVCSLIRLLFGTIPVHPMRAYQHLQQSRAGESGGCAELFPPSFLLLLLQNFSAIIQCISVKERPSGCQQPKSVVCSCLHPALQRFKNRNGAQGMRFINIKISEKYVRLLRSRA